MLRNRYRLLKITAVGMVFFGLLVMMRLIHVQGIQGEKYQQLAEQNRVYVEPVPAERGVFLDRYDQPLVKNVRQYTVAESQAVFSATRPVSQPEALTIAATQSGLVRYQFARKYAYPTALAHVIGYTGAMTAEALKTDTRKLLTDQTGVMGLEKSLDPVVLGKPGKLFFEVNAMGNKQRQLEQQDAQAGTSVKTTLDPYISQVMSQIMGNVQGAAVVMDAQTGHLLAVISQPTFDSNDFQPLNFGSINNTEKTARLQSYFSDEKQVLFNRAVSGMYPPGSVFKLITALSALEHDAVKADTVVEDQGILRVGEYEYANWYYTQYGRIEGAVTLEKAIARSNDIYFYKAAEWLGPNQLAKTARLYGLGQPTGIELAGEAAGLIPDPAWKEKALGEPWYLGNTFHFGIGQGDVLVTPIQVAQMVQAIANNQTICTPSLLKEPVSKCHDLGVSNAATDVVLSGMIAACSDGGTGYPLFPHNRTYMHSGTAQEKLAAGMVACKTGTAEFGGADARGYRKTHAWFVAIVPTAKILEAQIASQDTRDASSAAQLQSSQQIDRKAWLQAIQQHGFPKQLVVVVLVESSEKQPFAEGSREAAPVAAQLIDWMAGKTP